MLDRLKQLLAAFISQAGDGSDLSEITFQNSFSNTDEGSVVQTVGLQYSMVLPPTEEKRYSMKDGEVH